MQVLQQDLRQALRQLRRNPGFAVMAILTLSLGIGAAVAVFSVAYGVLIDPFPYRNVRSLATPKLCSSHYPRCYWDVYTSDQFLEIERDTDIFSGITASTISYVALTGGSEPERVRGNYMTPNTFEVLGVQPVLGRASSASDVLPGHQSVALLSYRYWQAHFGGSSSILGGVLEFDHQPRTIIGVMPPRFLWRGADVYLPIDLSSAHSAGIPRYFALVGRIRSGVTSGRAAAELLPVFRQFAKVNPGDFPADLRVSLMPFDQMFQSGLASTLYLLLGAVFVLLLIACVNVSSLLLARAVSRDHEMVVRTAVGASPLRLARSGLTESLLLALAALPVSLAFAWIGLNITLRMIPADTIPDEAVVTLSMPVMLISFAIALFTVVFFGFAPVWHSARPRLMGALNSARTTSGRGEQRVLSGFVVTEIALSLVLLMLAGLTIRSLLAVESTPVPFPPAHTLLVRIPLDKSRYPTLGSRNRFFREALARVASLPGVRSVTTDAGFFGMGSHVRIGSQPINPQRDFVLVHAVDPQYLTTSSRALLAGRFITQNDVQVESQDAVVTQSFARRYFPGGHALGQTFRLPEILSGEPQLKTDSFSIVGVISDIPPFPGDTERPQVLLPWSAIHGTDTLILATAVPAAVLTNTVRRTIASIDADQPLAEMSTVQELLDRYGYAGPRFMLALFGAFAGVAVLLSVVGIYGVLSFLTFRRTREIGVRMALGANRANVMWMVLRQACLLALLGIAAGLPLAFVAGRLARQELFNTSQFDLGVIAAAVAVLPLLAVAGTWLPARRASGIDPVRALRAE